MSETIDTQRFLWIDQAAGVVRDGYGRIVATMLVPASDIGVASSTTAAESHGKETQPQGDGSFDEEQGEADQAHTSGAGQTPERADFGGNGATAPDKGNGYHTEAPQANEGLGSRPLNGGEQFASQDSADLDVAEEPVPSFFWIDISADVPVDGFSDRASKCITRAGWIAFIMNHTCISTAHLILALSLYEEAEAGLRRRQLDTEKLKEAAIPMLLKEKWQYAGTGIRSRLSPTSDLWRIFEAAKRRAGERDNQPASLSDLLDVLKDLHTENRLMPRARQVEISDRVEELLGSIGDLRESVETGFRSNASQLNSLQRSTADLMVAHNSELLKAMERSAAELVQVISANRADPQPNPRAGTCGMFGWGRSRWEKP